MGVEQRVSEEIDPGSGHFISEAIELITATQTPIKMRQLIKLISKGGYPKRAVKFGIKSELTRHGLFALNPDLSLRINPELNIEQINARLGAWNLRKTDK